MARMYSLSRWCAILAWVSICLCQDAAVSSNHHAEQYLNNAIAAASAGDLPRAKQILELGRLAYPRDPRFAVELAGIAFVEKDNSGAKQWLHRARRLGSSDPYVNEFLGTLYLLDGNTEAALALWNPIDRPVLVNDQITTGLEQIVRPGLASDAAPFRAAGVLRRQDYLRSGRVTTLLGVCGSSRVELEADVTERFRAQVRCVEQPGLGNNRVGTLVLLARGLGYQAVHLRLPNIGRSGVAWNSMIRWDARKRRIWSEASMPIAGKASWRFRIFGDGRDEQWQMLSGKNRDVTQAFRQRRWEAGVAVSAVLGSRTTWENRLSVANRSFASLSSIAGGDERLEGGSSFRYAHRIESDVYRNPLRRIVATASGEASLERYRPIAENVVRGEGRLLLAWNPAASGSDGRTALRLSAGGLGGSPPLTELYAIGLERDGGIPLRAHIGTSDGRKGSAIYGDRYMAANLDIQKILLRAGVVTLAVAPFLDAAWVRDPARRYGARKTQFDAGIQWIASTPGGTEIRLSYGWNLRNGRGAFYAWSEPFP